MKKLIIAPLAALALTGCISTASLNNYSRTCLSGRAMSYDPAAEVNSSVKWRFTTSNFNAPTGIWHFAGGSSGTGPTRTIAAGGSETITATVQDSEGDSRNLSKTVANVC